MPSSLRTIVRRVIESRRSSDQKEANSDLLQYQPRKRDLPDLYWAIQQSYPDDRHAGSDARGLLLCKLRGIHDAGTPAFVRDIFPMLLPNQDLQESALVALSEINTTASLQVLCNILIAFEPKLRSDDNSAFSSVVRKPKHASVLFPKLLKLLANRTYRRGIYEVAAAALEARTVSPNALAPALPRLIQDFREAYRSFARTKRESIERQGRLEYVACVLKVMGAFPDDPELRSTIQSCLRIKDTQLAFVAYRISHRHGWELPKDANTRFAADPTTRLEFFELLEASRCAHEFPKEWRTQEAFAEGDIVRFTLKDWQPAFKIKLLETRVVKPRGEKGRVYIYKLKRPSFTREWVIGISGPQPLEVSEMVLRGAGTFCYDWTLRDAGLDEHLEVVEDLVAKARKAKPRRISWPGGENAEPVVATECRRVETASERPKSIDPGHSHPSVDAIPIPRMTAKQLHTYAESYNWDGGVGPMRRIIRHPKCDLGTALLIFWRTDPRFYYESWSRGGSAGIGTPEAALLKEIVNKVQAGRFRTAEFPFNPGEDNGHDWTAGRPSAIAIGIPRFMCEPILALGRKNCQRLKKPQRMKKRQDELL